jgi:uncharacterized protein (DUF1697 family)
MTTCIALFRGINVTGRHMVPMTSLKACLEKCGCTDVRTYIQSGNAVFQSGLRDTALIARNLSAAVAKAHGFEPRVIVLTRPQLERAVARNPFAEADADPKSVHAFFLAERPKKPDAKALDAVKAPSERFALDGSVFYLHTPEGFGISKLAARAERLLGVDATARNWRTVRTLVEMAKPEGA